MRNTLVIFATFSSAWAILCYTYFSISVFALSPPFPQQEITDEVGQWFDLYKRNLTGAGDRNTDIVSVDYSSNGTTLDAILWLLFPFIENPIRENVNYGMFVDSDFNRNSGFGGIDYQIEIRWNNETKQWNKVIEQWSHNGKTRVVDNETDYKDFYHRGSNYVVLSSDLGKILYPQKYKVVFYAEAKKGGSYKSDFTRWVAVPPLQLVVSPSQNSLEIIKGDKTTIEVNVSSTQGYEPTVNIYASNHSRDVGLNFTYKTLRIPSFGTSSTPVTVNVSKDASTGPHTLFIFANSSFPPEEFLKPKSEKPTSDFLSSLGRNIPTENIISHANMLVTVKDPPDTLESISIGWDKLGGPISFMYGVIAGISPWLYTKINKSLKGKRKTRAKADTHNR
jgi:hypothetical protein